MGKQFDPAITEYLREKEHLPLAFEIGHYANQLRQEIAREFWTEVEDALRGGTAQSGTWVIEPLNAYREDTQVGYRGINFIPASAKGLTQALGFAAEWELFGDKCDIYVG